jgi:hypothetical protein
MKKSPAMDQFIGMCREVVKHHSRA